MLHQQILVLCELAKVATQAAVLLKKPSQARRCLVVLGRALDRIAVPSTSEEEYFDPAHARTVLLDIVRRAAHDWVLWKDSKDAQKEEIAKHAYTWLFEEGPKHPWWAIRASEGKHPTSLIAICDALDIDIKTLRQRIRQLTPKQIKNAGRPRERRRKQIEDNSHYIEHGVTVAFVFSDDVDDVGFTWE